MVRETAISSRPLAANLAPKINLSALEKPGQERLTSFSVKNSRSITWFFRWQGWSGCLGSSVFEAVAQR
jgi:hypothetical protein